MSDAVYEQLARVEDRLWWHESRRELIRVLLRKVSVPANAAALDVGCGTGGSFSLLSEYAARVVGIDLSPRALELAKHKHRSAELHLADANALTQWFDNESFDLVSMLNVLYHRWILDEVAALRQVWAVLKPGGVIVISDPAFACLFRRHDRVVRGRRRFTLGQMRKLLSAAQFDWVAGTYFNMVSFLPAWCLARWDGVRPHTNGNGPLGEIAVPPFPINDAMQLVMACERAAIRLLGRTPFGVTLLCVARKPGQLANRKVEGQRSKVKCRKVGTLDFRPWTLALGP